VLVGGLALQVAFDTLDVTAQTRDTFEGTLRSEISAAANVSVTRVHVVHSQAHSTNQDVTLVRFEIHDSGAVGEPSGTEALSILSQQAADTSSPMRTQGTFLRRIQDTSAAFYGTVVVAEQVGTPGASLNGVNSFPSTLTGSTDQPAGQEEGSTADTGLSGANIAGIVIATSFIGVGAIAGSAWFVCHKTAAGRKFKQMRTERSMRMKIQLTEEEKGELGMHSNPSFAQEHRNSMMQSAVQVIKAAVAQDEARNYRGAIALYESGVSKFMEAMKVERSSEYKFQLAKRVDKYMLRIKELKKFVGSNPSGRA